MSLSFHLAFRGYSRAHGRSAITSETRPTDGKAKARVWTEETGATEADYNAHLKGSGPGIGIAPLLDDNESVVFGAIDIDDYTLEYDALEAAIETLPLTATRSKSGGVHVWLHGREALPAKLVRQKLTAMAAALGYPKAEIFPKQDKREEGDIGNWINLPYYGGKRIARRNGKDLSVDEFLKWIEEKSVTAEQLEKLVVTTAYTGGDPMSDGAVLYEAPPCLETFHQRGVGEGDRNKVLFNVAVYYKKFDEENWKDLTLLFNEKYLNPPLPANELRRTLLRSVAKKNYRYTCKDQPLKGVCNSSLCVQRTFGIEGTQQKEFEYRHMAVGTFKSLLYVQAAEPYYLLTVDAGNGETFEVKIENFEVLTRYETLRARIMGVRPCYVPPLKKDDWEEVLYKLVSNAQTYEIFEEATGAGIFHDLLTGFIEERAQEDKEMVLNGAVYSNGTVYIFRTDDFIKHCKDHSFKVKKAEAMKAIRDDYEGDYKNVRFHNSIGGVKPAWVVEKWRVEGALDGEEGATFEEHL